MFEAVSVINFYKLEMTRLFYSFWQSTPLKDFCLKIHICDNNYWIIVPIVQ